ncbi:HAD family hydrolase [Vibrio ostreicida]|uniref:HAD family hydrolase n=1 Tax=Vibrio ostreicida TaxID=526588 RepID=UPI000970CF34|nr:HAD family hydrolase [Vibrio ostreicida]
MKNIAIFDFDETLIMHNSLPKLFGRFVARSRFPLYIASALFDRRIMSGQYRKLIKEKLYRKALKGKSRKVVFEAGYQVCASLRPIPEVVAEMFRQHHAGVEIWIVTASPQEFVQGVVEGLDWPVKKVIGTSLNHRNDILDGTYNIECEYDEKVARFHTENAKHGDNIVVASYGNPPQDEAVVHLGLDRYFVESGQLRQLSH